MNRISKLLRTIGRRLPLLILGALLGVVGFFAVESRQLEHIRRCDALAVEAIEPFEQLRSFVQRAAVRDAREHVEMFQAAYEDCR